jgi:hypothetical protein
MLTDKHVEGAQRLMTQTDERSPSMDDPFRTDRPTERRFEVCAKCGCSSVEALWCKGGPMPLVEAPENWWVKPEPTLMHDEENEWDNIVAEGFFVRCRQCSFAWYETLRPQDRSPDKEGP